MNSMIGGIEQAKTSLIGIPVPDGTWQYTCPRCGTINYVPKNNNHDWHSCVSCGLWFRSPITQFLKTNYWGKKPRRRQVKFPDIGDYRISL